MVSQQHVLVQTFEFGGQRQYRRGAAAANGEQAHGMIQQAELMNAAQTTRLFFTALYQRELRDMNHSLADMNEQLIGVIQRQEKAGQANGADVELARLQAQSSRRQQLLVEASYQTAIISLRNQLNLDANTPMELASQWVDWRWRSFDDVIGKNREHTSTGNPSEDTRNGPSKIVVSLPADDDATLRQLVVGRPDVVVARAAVSMSAENMRLANAMRRSNVQMGPLWQQDNTATVYWGVQAQMDLPVVNTGVPLVEQRFPNHDQQANWIEP